MARPQTPPIFAQMRHARSYTEQVTALRALKNDVTGHIQKKEQWVEAGILDHIVKLLQNARTRQGQNGKVPGSEVRPHALSDQEQVRLQALQLLSIFAKGKMSILLLFAALADERLQADPRSSNRYRRPVLFRPS
jgi:hypothetical protein